jgi:hypothetical protein
MVSSNSTESIPFCHGENEGRSGAEIQAPDAQLPATLVAVEEARIDALLWALDRVLRTEGA